MTDKLNEKISALMDHQLSAPEGDELAGRIAHDSSLRDCWARYHLIGDALRNNGRNNLPDNIKHDLAARVAKVIDAEAPLPISLDIYRHTHRYAKGRAAAFFQPVVGMAIAASVAMVAIVSFNMTSGVNPTGQQLVMVPLQNSASMMSSQSVIAPAPAAPQITDPALANPRLAGYLEDHSKYSNTSLVQGQMLPYVRIVGYAPKQ